MNFCRHHVRWQLHAAMLANAFGHVDRRLRCDDGSDHNADRKSVV